MVAIEKPLYQIAVERFLDRLVRAKGTAREKAINLVRDAALGPMSAADREASAVELRRLLFPELGR